jgi:2-dehydropantoate 2-reductase
VKKIAIVGTGAMGSVYAGLFASAGYEVWAIDRWKEHVDAMRAKARQANAPCASTPPPTRAKRDPAISSC